MGLNPKIQIKSEVRLMSILRISQNFYHSSIGYFNSGETKIKVKRQTDRQTDKQVKSN